MKYKKLWKKFLKSPVPGMVFFTFLFFLMIVSVRALGLLIKANPIGASVIIMMVILVAFGIFGGGEK